MPPPTFDAVHHPDRLVALRATGILATPPEESFDRLTRLAMRLVGVPVAFVSFVDENRDFYKSQCGFGEPLATVRELEGTTFCHATIASDQPLIIADTRADPVFRQVPTVESLGVAAYAGIPIHTASGHALGSFCAIDFVPRLWTDRDIEVLTELALSAERELQLREAARLDRAKSHALEEQVVESEMLSEEVECVEAGSGALRQDVDAGRRDEDGGIGISKKLVPGSAAAIWIARRCMSTSASIRAAMDEAASTSWARPPRSRSAKAPAPPVRRQAAPEIPCLAGALPVCSRCPGGRGSAARTGLIEKPAAAHRRMENMRGQRA